MGNKTLPITKKSSSYFSFKTFGKTGNPVIFFFTAFRTAYYLYYPTIKILTCAGYCVIVYDIDPSMIFHGELKDFLEVVQALLHTVKKQVTYYKKAGVTSFFSYGTSMGTIFAIRAAIDIPEITKVIINLTYGSLADNVWSWKALKGVKKRLEKQGIDKNKLEKLLEFISPLSMAPKLKEKKVLLYLAKNDRIILFQQSLQFKEALDRASIEYVYYQNNYFGHIIGGTVNNLRSKRYVEFLKR